MNIKQHIKSLPILLCAVLLLSGSVAAELHAQGRKEKITVHGIVKDPTGEPITGASVLEVGTKNGVTTGFEGDYSLEVTKGRTIRVTFLGFEDVEIVVEKDKYDIIMYEAATQLDQVVVTGYSNVELRKSTGAVSVVKMEDIKDSPLKNIDQMLQGQLAGVNVTAASGRPGEAAKVRIRGTNTITGNAEPLWVIDGVPLQKDVPEINSSQLKSGDFDNIFASGIGSINPSDIESITVLKDASAAAIYGSQASNGVIVVTTKRGEAGNTSISYMGSVSVQIKPARSANLMNSKEKLAWEQELWDEFSSEGYVNGGYYPKVGIIGQIRGGYGEFADLSAAEQDAVIESLGANTTDWFDTLFRNTVSTTHHLSLSGGSPKMTYYVSGGMGFNNGIVKKTDSRSTNLSAKIDTRPAKWMKLGISTDFSYLKANAPSSNVDMFKYAYFANPYEKLYNEDGSYAPDRTWFTLGYANGKVNSVNIPDNGFNLMREINETSSLSTSTSFTIQGNTTIEICKGLNFTGLGSFSYYGDLSENINGKETYAAFRDRPFEENYYSKRTYGSITQQTTTNTSWLLRGQLNYAQTFSDIHSISAIGGAEIRSSYAESLFTKRYGYDTVTGNHSTPLFPSTSDNKIDYEKLVSFGNKLDGCSGQSISENAFASFYGTLTYTLLNRYIFSGTVRSDGSNNFGSKEQFNANWSVSGAWNIDQEPWIANTVMSKVFSTLSLRSGFGYTGGVNKSVYPVLMMEYDSTFRKTDDDYYRKGYISNAPNPNLRWEKNRTFNVGLNMGFLHDRITGEVSYYRNKNLDLVTSVKVPYTTGFTSQSFNTTEQVNNGVELTLGATLLKIRDFQWRVMANMAYNYNVLTKYDSPTKSLSDAMYVGYPLGKIFTGKTSGIDPETGVYKYIMRPDVTVTKQEDYRLYQNYLFYVGTSNAPWTGGFSTTFSYKSLSLNIVGNVSIGGKIINNISCPVSWQDVSSATTESLPSVLNDLYANHLNVTKDVTHRWTETNHVTDGYPRLIDSFGPKLTDGSGQYLTSIMPYSTSVANCLLLEDVSYLKISSISLSYSLPAKWLKGIKGLNVSFLMNNLFILTNYSGIDPETPGAVYPKSRSFSFSLGVDF